MSQSQIASAYVRIIQSVIETIRESGPLGAPCGTIYAALMQHGCTMQQYEQIERIAISTGKVEKRGHCLHWID